MPTTWYEGPFLGNGFLGSGIYAEPGANAVRFNVQHSEVQDHRPEFGSLFGLARLPIGYLTLRPAGAITGVDWRLDLWNAELRGVLTTSAGSLRIRAIVHSERSVLQVDVTPTDGERGFAWAFHPAVAVSPRAEAVFGRPPPAREVRWHRHPDGDIQLTLAQGQEALIHAAATRPDLTVAPVPATAPTPPLGSTRHRVTGAATATRIADSRRFRPARAEFRRPAPPAHAGSRPARAEFRRPVAAGRPPACGDDRGGRPAGSRAPRPPAGRGRRPPRAEPRGRTRPQSYPAAEAPRCNDHGPAAWTRSNGVCASDGAVAVAVRA